MQTECVGELLCGHLCRYPIVSNDKRRRRRHCSHRPILVYRLYLTVTGADRLASSGQRVKLVAMRLFKIL